MNTWHTTFERTRSRSFRYVAMLTLLYWGCQSGPAAVSPPPTKSLDEEAAATADAGQTAADMGHVAILDAQRHEAADAGRLSADEQRFVDSLRTSPPQKVVLTYKVDLTEAACSPYVDLRGFKTRHCAHTVEMAHAATSTDWANEFGRVEFSPFSVTQNGVPLWGVTTACEGWVTQELALDSCREYNSAPSYQRWESHTLRPLSLVGPIVSFTNFSASYGGGGTVNSYAETAYSFDLRTGEDAAFDALVTTESMLAALKADPYLTKSLNPKLQNAATVEDVWKLWEVENFWRFGAYHFHEWSPRRGEVAMRILFLERADGLNPNNLRSLGIWVKPKPEFRAAFEAASRGRHGFLAGP